MSNEPVGAVSCINCTAGFYADNIASSECKACSPGFFGTSRGQIECERCAIGTYAPGTNSTVCNICPASTTTMVLGAAAARDCACPAEFYAPVSASGFATCTTCPKGIVCPFGSSFNVDTKTPSASIVQQKGYWPELTSSGFSVFQCRGYAEQCPAGPPKSCAAGRGGLACADCQPYMKPRSDGTCTQCQQVDQLPVAAVSIGMFFIIGAAYYAFDQENKSRQTHSLLFVVIVAGQTITIIQLLGVMSMFSMNFAEPFNSLLAFMKLFNFDVGVLEFGCVTTATPIGHYVLRICLVLISAAAMIFFHFVFVMIRHRADFQGRRPVVIAALGTIFMAFFISTVATILAPFQCSANPNGIYTVRNYESTICWQGGEHAGMLAIASVAFLIPVAFLTFAALAIWYLPSKIHRGATQFVRATGFLVYRFRPGFGWHVAKTTHPNSQRRTSPILIAVIKHA